MKYLSLLFFFLIGINGLFAQGNVNIHYDDDIETLFWYAQEAINAKKTISGWRVQIISVTDRRQLDKTRRDFMEKYPDIKESWNYEAPYYKLKVGAFREKSEAMHLKYLLKAHYPDVYLIRDDNIKPSEFLGN